MQTEQQAPSPTIVLPDGSIEFQVKRRDGTVNDHKIDLLLLKMACDECIAQHALVVKDGRYISTVAFLMDLAGRLQVIGIEGCSASVASQLWVAAYEGFESLKKSTNETPSLHSGSESTQEPSVNQNE